MITITEILQEVEVTIEPTTEVINIQVTETSTVVALEVTETVSPTIVVEVTQNTPNQNAVSPYNATFIFEETPQTVPLGFTGIITNLNSIYADVTFTVDGTELTVTGGADVGEKLLINGQY